jgi:hypothetical protein
MCNGMTQTKLPGILAGEAASPPEPANDNWGLVAEGQTPAEAMQIIRRLKARMRAELAADFRRRADPEHRQNWDILIEMEKCARWLFYREREG